MGRTTNANIDRVVALLIKHHIPFDMESTQQRNEIFSKIGNYSNVESEFPPSELNFIRQVKDYVIKNEIYKKIPNRFPTPESRVGILYYHVSPRFKVGDLLDKYIEIDLNSAYWETAYKMGLLSEALYARGKTISKTSRLAAIGTLAKVKKRFKFDGVKQWKLPKVRSELTEFLWHTICDKIGKLMLKTARKCGKDFAFVWVDALFVHRDAVPEVRKIFKKAGYEFTVEKVKWIRFDKSQIVVKGKGKWVEIDGKQFWKDERGFPFSTGSGMAQVDVDMIKSSGQLFITKTA